MRIVIVGAGALGSIVAAMAARAGASVAVVARGKRADLIEQQGIRPFNCGMLSSPLFFFKPLRNAVALVPPERVGIAETGKRAWQIDRQLRGW